MLIRRSGVYSYQDRSSVPSSSHEREQLERVRLDKRISYPTLLTLASDMVGRLIKDIGELTKGEVLRMYEAIKRGSYTNPR